MPMEQYCSEHHLYPEVCELNTESIQVHRTDKASLRADLDSAAVLSNKLTLTVTVDALSTSDTTPELTGQLNDPSATIALTVDGNPYVPTNNGDGTWTLADGAIAPALALGTYDVAVTITGPDGKTGSTPGTAKLEIV